jgi:succinate dehydrogenase/fumarate reductase flavoprotein subunit
MIEHTTIDCDLLVLGAGMAGLSAAGLAAEAGANVIVIERARSFGGSALLSGGFVWTATSPGRMNLFGGGCPDLSAVVLRNYAVGLEWMRRRGVTMSRAVSVLHGRGYQVDLHGHMRSCINLVEQHGGHVVFDTETQQLLLDENGEVAGARTSHPDGVIDVRAKTTVLATGGYQNSAELRAKFIHPKARDGLLLRTNPTSRGDGIELAMQVGAEAKGTNPGFYGHLVSESPQWGDPRLFTLLTQYHSEFALLLNEQGLRFCDETLGDHVNANTVLLEQNSRAICFWDARIHETKARTAVVKGAEVVDKMQVALEHHGNGIVAETLADIERFATSQRFDGGNLRRTIETYNEACRTGWEKLQPLRAENFGALDNAPFYALVVRPAITQSHGGLSVDSLARVLRSDGSVVSRLLAAGGDAGDIYGTGYAGGLAAALAYGVQAATTAGFGGSQMVG